MLGNAMHSCHVVLISSLFHLYNNSILSSFQNYVPFPQLSLHSWQLTSCLLADASRGKLKLPDGNFISSLPPNQHTYLHLCSSVLLFSCLILFPYLSPSFCLKSTSSPGALDLTPSVFLRNCTSLSLLSLYWSFWWSFKTYLVLTDETPFNHKSSSCCLTDLLPSGLLRRCRCTYFLSHFLICIYFSN